MDSPILRFDRYSRPNEQSRLAEVTAWLEITCGRVRHRLRPVRGPVFLIGTATDCDLVLGDLAFPETYAYVLLQDQRLAIRRVGEGPQLLLNGEAIEAADLHQDDRLGFGSFEVRVHVKQRVDIQRRDLPVLPAGRWILSGDLAEI